MNIELSALTTIANGDPLDSNTLMGPSNSLEESTLELKRAVTDWYVDLESVRHIEATLTEVSSTLPKNPGYIKVNAHLDVQSNSVANKVISYSFDLNPSQGLLPNSCINLVSSIANISRMTIHADRISDYFNGYSETAYGTRLKNVGDSIAIKLPVAYEYSYSESSSLVTRSQETSYDNADITWYSQHSGVSSSQLVKLPDIHTLKTVLDSNGTKIEWLRSAIESYFPGSQLQITSSGYTITNGPGQDAGSIKKLAIKTGNPERFTRISKLVTQGLYLKEVVLDPQGPEEELSDYSLLPARNTPIWVVETALTSVEPKQLTGTNLPYQLVTKKNLDIDSVYIPIATLMVDRIRFLPGIPDVMLNKLADILDNSKSVGDIVSYIPSVNLDRFTAGNSTHTYTASISSPSYYVDIVDVELARYLKFNPNTKAYVSCDILCTTAAELAGNDAKLIMTLPDNTTYLSAIIPSETKGSITVFNNIAISSYSSLIQTGSKIVKFDLFNYDDSSPGNGRGTGVTNNLEQYSYLLDTSVQHNYVIKVTVSLE